MQIMGVDGQPVGMKAINYFGFNNGATMFDGLYAGSNSLTQDFGLTLYRLQVIYLSSHCQIFMFSVSQAGHDQIEGSDCSTK
jgi:hypothetical protein